MFGLTCALMKLTVQIRLLPNPAQEAALRGTLRLANDAANLVAEADIPIRCCTTLRRSLSLLAVRSADREHLDDRRTTQGPAIRDRRRPEVNAGLPQGRERPRLPGPQVVPARHLRSDSTSSAASSRTRRGGSEWWSSGLTPPTPRRPARLAGTWTGTTEWIRPRQPAGRGQAQYRLSCNSTILGSSRWQGPVRVVSRLEHRYIHSSLGRPACRSSRRAATQEDPGSEAT